MMYEFFGLRVQSPFELPIAGIVSDDIEVPDITFAWGDPADSYDRPIGEPVSSIRCDCPLHNGQPILGLLLVGLTSTFVLHQRGIPWPHCSVVRIGEDAIVFLGSKGREIDDGGRGVATAGDAIAWGVGRV